MASPFHSALLRTVLLRTALLRASLLRAAFFHVLLLPLLLLLLLFDCCMTFLLFDCCMTSKRDNPRWDEDSGVVPPSAADPASGRSRSSPRDDGRMRRRPVRAHRHAAVGRLVVGSRRQAVASGLVVVPAVLASSKCSYLTTQADVNGRADAGMCCRGRWEW